MILSGHGRLSNPVNELASPGDMLTGMLTGGLLESERRLLKLLRLFEREVKYSGDLPEPPPDEADEEARR